MNFYKHLFTLALPIILQNFVDVLVNLADTIMIGRLGTVEIAALGLGNQFFFLCTMVLYGINSGAGIFVAQFWGKQDLTGIRQTMGLSLVLSSSTALLFTAATALIPDILISIYTTDPAVIATGATYLRTLSPAFIPFGVSFVWMLTLRGIERVSLATTATVISLSANVALNYVFIFGNGPVPALGVQGAALGTVLARCAEAGILIMGSRPYKLTGTVRELFGFSRAFAARYLRVTAPVISNEVLWSLGMSSQSIIFGRTSTAAIAAFNITNTVSQLTWVIFIGLGNAAGVLVGKKIGEGNEAAARDYAKRITRFAPLLAAGVAFLLIPVSWLMPVLFDVEPAVLQTVSWMFVVLACSYPCRGFNMAMIIGVCRAGGDTIFSVVYDLAFMAVSLPLATVAAFYLGAPPVVIYGCLCVEDWLKVFLGAWRLRSGRWLHNVTV